ncbi:Gfo/Idh/MocA family protein [Leucobacter triazinivorans]|uniref:Gfo/Idh/MocA family oxidoreductase n=1 Tax=Leucobacter triazinivorans TaxID=1784719 RepID=A0A4P6KGA8_9MICO|nr:Gfo/Idh/MocA family oxidoreductase [Leucobacter triazinivorans]QBE49018.1 Gfo/Idh/MocA family oxidoreductase [Leucobacter triazinivorans]
MSAPLRIGLLGASRIAELAITEASGETGDIRAAVAARDPERARAYAREHGYEGIRESYEALVADDSLDLIYIGLPNGLHAEWTVRALDAGRSVLVEKPFAANLAEFDRVAARLESARGWAWEAFHYADHPAVHRLIDLVRRGEIGEIREVDVHMDMPSPSASDPRWNFDLAGGTMMDLGCYALNGLLLLGDAVGAPVELVSAEVDPYEGDARVDATVRARLALGSAPVTMHTSMVSPDWNFGLRVFGSLGEVRLPNFVKPQEDDRLIVRTTTGAGVEDREERAGTVSSYVYQLRRLRDAVRGGERSTEGRARSRRTMALIDAVYAAGGLPVRPGRLAG